MKTILHLPTPRVFCPRCKKEIRYNATTANPTATCLCRVRQVRTLKFFEVRDVQRRLSFHHSFGVVAEGGKVLLVNQQYLISLERGWYAIYTQDSREPLAYGRYTWIPNIPFLHQLLSK